MSFATSPRPLRGAPTGMRRPAGGWLAALAVAAAMAGCATPMDARKDAAYQEAASVADRPVVRPVRSVSSFSQSLMCMDQMLRAAELPTTLITSKRFVDFSGKVPAATKEMVITALSQMSRISNAFRFVDFEVDIARQDTVQNLTTILLNNNQMQLQRPALYVSGAIAFVDQGVINNTFDTGVSGTRVDLGHSRSRNATVVALEVHLGDFRTRTIIPGLDSANEVVIGSGGQGVDLGGRIGSYGVRFNVGRDYAVGTGAALRTLVDLAMIELVGKWARVPYWQCLTLDQSHAQFQRQMREWYVESGSGGQFQLLRSSLISQGYLPAASGELGVAHPDMRDALARFQADRGIPVSGTVDFPTYEAALGNFVSLAEDGSLARMGWNGADLQPVVAAAAGDDPRAARPSPPKPARWAIDLQIENPQPAGERPAFDEGEQIFLSATVSRASHLYCYFADSAGAIMRLLPNLLQPHTLVSANQAIRIPDWMAPNPGFILDAGRPGTEAVMCLATTEEALHKMAPQMRTPPLARMPAVRTLDELRERFAEVAGPEGLVTQSVQWTVGPRKAAQANGGAPAQRQ